MRDQGKIQAGPGACGGPSSLDFSVAALISSDNNDILGSVSNLVSWFSPLQPALSSFDYQRNSESTSNQPLGYNDSMKTALKIKISRDGRAVLCPAESSKEITWGTWCTPDCSYVSLVSIFATTSPLWDRIDSCSIYVECRNLNI
jgi:hypothetical protein